MKLIRDLDHLKRTRAPIVAAAGFFDGVHLGHQKILGQALQRAGEIGGQAWVLTFEPHPLRVLNPDAAPPLLTSTKHKLLLLERLGLQGCLLLPFNRKLADTEPEAFAGQLLACCPPLVEIVVGRNWRFGRKGRGNPALLARMSGAAGLKVRVTPARVWKGETISSTRIRAAVLSGDLEEAAAMLGRPFSLLGTVRHGEGIGRELGYPTANLDPHNETLPPHGVYAAVATILDDQPHGRKSTAAPACVSVVNFGVRPTFEHIAPHKPVIEVHLLDLERNLYGVDVDLRFVARLRSERKFSSPDALRAQIRKDIEAARKAVGKPLQKNLKRLPLHAGIALI
jgi:riboflavin kinase/FMN adenylyltransferase